MREPGDIPSVWCNISEPYLGPPLATGGAIQCAYGNPLVTIQLADGVGLLCQRGTGVAGGLLQVAARGRKLKVHQAGGADVAGVAIRVRVSDVTGLAIAIAVALAGGVDGGVSARGCILWPTKCGG